MGTHASGPPPDPNDELRDMFRVEIDEQSRREGWKCCRAAVSAAAAAAAVGAFTAAFLGPWRFLFVVPVGLYAAYLSVFAVIFLLTELAARATAPGAPRWLRFVARNLGNGLFGLLIGLVFLGCNEVLYPQPWPWVLYPAVAVGSFLAGVAVGVRRRHRRRARWPS